MSSISDMVGYTPTGAVIAICITISIIAAATWRNAKGEGWDLVVFLGALVLGFNLSITFASWTLESLAAVFGSMGSWIGDAASIDTELGSITLILGLIVVTYLMTKIEFDLVRIAALGTLFGIILRLLTDFLWFWFA
mgnify:CR=1 FL=1